MEEKNTTKIPIGSFLSENAVMWLISEYGQRAP